MKTVLFRDKNNLNLNLDQRILTTQNINQVKDIVKSVSGKIDSLKDYAPLSGADFTGNVHVSGIASNTYITSNSIILDNENTNLQIKNNNITLTDNNDNLTNLNINVSDFLLNNAQLNEASGLVQLDQNGQILSSLLSTSFWNKKQVSEAIASAYHIKMDKLDALPNTFLGYIDRNILIDNNIQLYHNYIPYNRLDEIKEFIHTDYYDEAVDKKIYCIPSTYTDFTLYFVKASETAQDNYYDEYLIINRAFEKIGTTRLDLNDYLLASVYNEQSQYFLVNNVRNNVNQNFSIYALGSRASEISISEESIKLQHYGYSGNPIKLQLTGNNNNNNLCIKLNGNEQNTSGGLVVLDENGKIPNTSYDSITSIIVANNSVLSGNGTVNSPLNIKYGTNVANGLVQLDQNGKIPSGLLPSGNTYYEFTNANIGANEILMIPNYGIPVMIKSNTNNYYPIQKTTLTEIQNANSYNLNTIPYRVYQNQAQIQGTWSVYYTNSVNHISNESGIMGLKIDQSLSGLVDVNIQNNMMTLSSKLVGDGIVVKINNEFRLLPFSQGFLQSNGLSAFWTESTTC